MSCLHTPNCIFLPDTSINEDNEIPITKSFDFASALGRFYNILDCIFVYLNLEDLKAAAEVTQEWQEAATRELNKRTQSTWVSLCKSYHGLIRSNNYGRHKTDFFIIAHRVSFQWKNFVCCHKGDVCVRTTFAEFLEAEVLPPSADRYCLLSCSSVIPTAEANTNGCVFHGVSIPPIENIRLVPFYFGPTTIIQDYIEPNEELMCCLMFTLHFNRSRANFFFAKLFMGHASEAVAMGGGFVRGSKAFLKSSNAPKIVKASDFFCIGFVQKRNTEAEFSATSIVSSDDEFSETIETLKAKTILRKDGVVFRFCCYDKRNKEGETALLSKAFPNYAVLSVDVDGELGWNSFEPGHQITDNSMISLTETGPIFPPPNNLANKVIGVERSGLNKITYL